MKEFKYQADDAYFCAANSYSGFYSEFERVFRADKFKRVYILKGGPGTGKSNLMKKLIAFGNTIGCKTEAIHCSSDPKSLDGAILSKNGASVAMVDGTAPHDLSPTLPGAADEIIDLAKHLNKSALNEKRSELFSMLNAKQNFYKTAYSMLKIAGAINDAIDDLISEYIDYSAAEFMVEDLVKYSKTPSDAPEKRKFISSFGRFGHTFIDGYNKQGISEIRIKGDGFSEFLIMEMLRKELSKQELITCVCPAVPCISKTDAIYTKDIIYRTSDDPDAYDCTNLYKDKPDRVTEMLNIRRSILNVASASLSDASKLHFELEKHYSEAMNFDKTKTLFDELKKEIASILS